MTSNTQQLLRHVNKFVSLRHRYFVVAIILIVVAAGYVTVLNPKLSEIRQVGFFDLQRTRNQYDLKVKIRDATKSLVKKYNNLNLADTASLKGVLPNGTDLPDLFVWVEGMAAASGLRVSNVNFSLPLTVTGSAAQQEDDLGVTTSKQAATTPATSKTATSDEKNGIKKLDVTFTVVGGHSYDDLKKFLGIVESSSRIFDVQSLSYAPAPVDQEESYLINAVTYYLGK